MRNIQIFYNTKGYLEVRHSDNATDKRIIEILQRAIKQLGGSNG